MRYIFLFLFVILSLSLSAQETLARDVIQKLDEISQSDQGPGGVIGIVHQGELIYSKAFGMANLAFDIPNETETIFNIASVSKQFTAYSLVLLEADGKLSIDDDIRKHIPEMPDLGKTITIRNLLTHTSGLRNFQNLLAMAGWREGDPMTNDDLLKFIIRQRELNFPVGSEYLYCNTGFVLAALIVERVTGIPFDQWVKANIFDPLGMSKTEFREDMTVVMKNTASGYNTGENGSYSKPLEFYSYMGNGNVYTTVHDLSKWIANFHTPQVGSKETIARLTERGVLTNGDTLTYAQGIAVSNYRGLTRWSHGGSIGGYRSQLAYFPRQDMVLLRSPIMIKEIPAEKLMTWSL